MEPTPGEYPSKMRVALVRRNPADGAAPLGLKKSRTSKSLQPYPFTPLSLTLQSLSLPSLRAPGGRCQDRTPPATSAAPPATAQPGADARSSRGQGSGPTAPTARQERTAPGRAGRGPAPTARQDQAAGPARRLVPRPPRTRAGSAWEPVPWPQAGPVPAFLSLHRSLHCSR